MSTIDPQNMMDLVEGKFAGTSRQQLAALFTAFKQGPNKTLVIHFHGGLVSKEAGIQNALDLNSRYSDVASCLFPIWETGLFEVLGRDWSNIALDTVFQVARDRVMSAVFAKAKEVAGVRGLTLDYNPGAFLPSDLTQSILGPGDVTVPQRDIDFSNLEPLTPIQERQLELEFARDAKLTGEFQAAINARVGRADPATRAAFTNPQITPKKSAIDPKALDQLVVESADTRGIPLGVAIRILGLVKEVIMRFIRKRDHGLHATATEEILRAFYLSTVGTSVWSQMKRYAHETFQPGPEYGGTALLEEIKQLPVEKQVLLIGHSAGAIFVSELLLAAVQAGITHPFDTIFLAPAARADLFAQVLSEAKPLLRNFRMYTMTDENEIRDILVRTNVQGDGLGWFYPRSLLYFISGILEPEVDSPLVGMQRFYAPQVWNANDDAVKAVHEFVLLQGQNRACWSVSDNPDIKLDANALSHGDFGHSVMLKGVQNSTVTAIQEILRTGAF